MIIQIITTILGILIFSGTLIVIWRTRKKGQREEIEPNLPICENPCRKEFTEGYYQGLVTKQLPRKNGCTLIEFLPTDNRQGENIPLPQVQSLIVGNDFIKRIPEGELSSRRTIIKLIGRSRLDYPESMRDTDEEGFMSAKGQKAWLKSTFGSAITSGDEAIAEAMKEYARGQIPKNVLQQIKDLNKKSREIILREQAETTETPKK